MAWSSIPLPNWIRWIGVALGVVAGVLLTWTLRTLGRNLTDTVVTRRDTPATTGPYRWIRHPFYSSVVLAVIANSLTAANWFLFITGGLVCTLLVIRCGREEENSISRFGDRYRNYMHQTGNSYRAFDAGLAMRECLCRPHRQALEAERASRPGPGQVCAGDQSQDRQGAWSRRAGGDAHPRRRDDRELFAAVHESAHGTHATFRADRG